MRTPLTPRKRGEFFSGVIRTPIANKRGIEGDVKKYLFSCFDPAQAILKGSAGDVGN
jgi:hypothetical protein